MAKRGDPKALRYVVLFLRTRSGMSQEDFGKAIRVDQAEISRFELGKKAPSEELQKRMAEAAKVPWPVVVHLRRFFARLVALLDHWGAGEVTPDFDRAIVEAVLLALEPYLIGLGKTEPMRQTPEEAFREAEEIWQALEAFPAAKIRRLVELAPRASRNWALALRIGEASERAAADKVEEALELANLALFIADRVPGKESRRSSVKAFCWAYVANASRVDTDFDRADEAFSQVWKLWPPGKPADPERLPQWRLLDLEASLRREQHRFSEALKLLDRARAASGGHPAAVGRILLKREHVYEEMGDLAVALATLTEAAPFVAASRDPHLHFTLHFNTADNLCNLDRFAEAAALLPQVREAAERQGNELDGLRVVWLGAKVNAGQGRKEEAIAGLEIVQQAFTDRKLPYDAARASLELAVLWLEAGRTAEVRELAVGMKWIFEAKKIQREALASLRLFCEAAERETATVELARRVMAEVEKVRR